MVHCSQFFKSIWIFWVQTWNENQSLFWAEAVAAISSIIASFALAWYAPVSPMVFVFIFYLIGSTLLIYAMYLRHSAWMIVMMGWYTAMNIIGLWNALLGG